MRRYASDIESDMTMDVPIDELIAFRCKQLEELVRQQINARLFVSFNGTHYSAVIEHPKGVIVAPLFNDKIEAANYYSIPFSEMEYIYKK